MNIGERHARLYRTLADMGLVVVPVFREAEPGVIDHLRVSTDLAAVLGQEGAERSPGGRVPLPVTGADIAMMVKSAERRGGNVIHMPAVLGIAPIFAAIDDATVAVIGEPGIILDRSQAGEDDV
jgi:hypothetical protein